MYLLLMRQYLNFMPILYVCVFQIYGEYGSQNVRHRLI